MEARSSKRIRLGGVGFRHRVVELMTYPADRSPPGGHGGVRAERPDGGVLDAPPNARGM
jgi:hypothetical protein